MIHALGQVSSKGAARQQGDQPLHCVKDSFVEAFKANVDDSCLRPSEPKGVVRQQGDNPWLHTRKVFEHGQNDHPKGCEIF